MRVLLGPLITISAVNQWLVLESVTMGWTRFNLRLNTSYRARWVWMFQAAFTVHTMSCSKAVQSVLDLVKIPWVCSSVQPVRGFFSTGEKGGQGRNAALVEASFPSRWIIYRQYPNSMSPFYRNTKLEKSKGGFLSSSFLSSAHGQISTADGESKAGRGAKGRGPGAGKTEPPALLPPYLLLWNGCCCNVTCLQSVWVWHRSRACLLCVHRCVRNTAHLGQDG